PGYRNVDLGLFRDIGLGNRFLLQLRAEATNAFNIVNLSNPGTGLNAPATFGKIRSARDMRRIQLGARLSFERVRSAGWPTRPEQQPGTSARSSKRSARRG